MWSNQYWYFTIQKDRFIYEDLEIDFVQDILLKTAYFSQVSAQNYENAAGFPWLVATILHSEQGNFSLTSLVPPKVNLVSITGSKGNAENLEKYIEMLLPIANKLNWRFFIEEDDEGNEYVEITA
jgi:hypothetical protein